MDNRTLLAQLPGKPSQLAWGRLCGAGERTVRRWFETGCKEPALVNTMLRFFVAHPRTYKAFVKFAAHPHEGVTTAHNVNKES